MASEVPLNDIINNRDAMGWIAKWAIELLPFDITYKPRRAIKSQVQADFVAEWAEAEPRKEYGALITHKYRGSIVAPFDK